MDGNRMSPGDRIGQGNQMSRHMAVNYSNRIRGWEYNKNLYT